MKDRATDKGTTVDRFEQKPSPFLATKTVAPVRR
jgi:hypothetical protein